MTLEVDVYFSYSLVGGIPKKNKGTCALASQDTRDDGACRPWAHLDAAPTTLSTQLPTQVAPWGGPGPHLLAWRPGPRSDHQ